MCNQAKSPKRWNVASSWNVKLSAGAAGGHSHRLPWRTSASGAARRIICCRSSLKFVPTATAAPKAKPPCFADQDCSLRYFVDWRGNWNEDFHFRNRSRRRRSTQIYFRCKHSPCDHRPPQRLWSHSHTFLVLLILKHNQKRNSNTHLVTPCPTVSFPPSELYCCSTQTASGLARLFEVNPFQRKKRKKEKNRWGFQKNKEHPQIQ